MSKLERYTPTASGTGKWILFWAALFGIAVIAILVRARLLDLYIISSDEAIHLIWLRLMAQGYRPYSEVYITYPPFYPMILALVWNIWASQAAQHWLSVAYAMFGAVGVALLARKFAGPLAGVIAAVLILFSPVLLAYSVAVLGEFPSVVWSVWSIYLAWLYRDATANRTTRLYLILSGLCMAASLLTKVLSPFAVALIPLIIISKFWPAPSLLIPLPVEKGSRAGGGVRAIFKKATQTLAACIKSRRFWSDLALWSAAFLLPFIIAFIVFDLGPLLQQVVGQRLEARSAYLDGGRFWLTRYNRAAEFWQEDTVLVVLAGLGLILTAIRHQKDLWLIVAWLLLALAMLLIHEPLRHKHFVILLPPLAILGGTAISVLWAILRQKSGWAYRLAAAAGLVVVLIFYPRQVQTTLAYWQARSSDPDIANYQAEALAFIEQITAPHDCLITDEMKLVYWANRMAPPELAEVSENRLKSGALTFEQLAAITDNYDCQVVAPVSDTPRIPKYLPDYIEWVEKKYLGQFEYGDDLTLYFAKADTTPKPGTPLRADFNGEILFHGYTLPAGPISPGERVPITLVWQAQTRPVTDYKIFVQVRNAGQSTLANADHEPYLGLIPTSSWPAGAVVQEMNWLTLPEDMAPGAYQIYVGLYRPDILERLPITNDTSGENALVLGPLVVQ